MQIRLGLLTISNMNHDEAERDEEWAADWFLNVVNEKYPAIVNFKNEIASVVAAHVFEVVRSDEE